MERAQHHLTSMQVPAASRAHLWCDHRTMTTKKILGCRDPFPCTIRRPCLMWNPAGECTCPDGKAYMVSDKGDSCGSLNCVGGTVTKACQRTDMADANAHGMGVSCSTGKQALCVAQGCGTPGIYTGIPVFRRTPEYRYSAAAGPVFRRRRAGIPGIPHPWRCPPPLKHAGVVVFEPWNLRNRETYPPEMFYCSCP